MSRQTQGPAGRTVALESRGALGRAGRVEESRGAGWACDALVLRGV